MTIARALRLLAIAIAVLGLVDPALTATRSVRHAVAVVTNGSEPAALAVATTLTRRLTSRYAVIAGAMPGAAATIVVGSALPAGTERIDGPAFVVTPNAVSPSVAITAADVPREPLLASRTPVHARVRVRDGAGRTVAVTLRQGATEMDRVEHAVTSADAIVDTRLDLVPISAGPAVVSIEAALVGAGAQASIATVDEAIDVIDRAWQVLFFDRRPSWASTFVRRALERDPRFSIRGRTGTSTGLAIEHGEAPASLDDTDAIRAIDVVVVGAPAQLTSDDVRGLEAFARRRGGTVVLLLDEAGDQVTSSLTRATTWRSVTSPAEVRITPSASSLPAFGATEFVVPASLPAGARARATAEVSGATRPVAYDLPTGPGQVFVSGVIDAWRYRGVPESSAFDRFWRETIGAAAAEAMPAIAVVPARRLVEPGEHTRVGITVRGVANEPPASGSVRLSLASSRVRGTNAVDAAMSVQGTRVWPDGLPGRFTAEFRAPPAAGTYRLTAEAGADRGEATVIVRPSIRRTSTDGPDALAAWVRTRGGQVFAEADVAGLDAALSATLLPEHRAAPWWPMRSGWWAGVLALSLGGEWWLRRRNDQR